jgi:hypothetical protein
MPSPSTSSRTTQLRIYTIAKGRLDDFVAAWMAGIRPLRERLGFAVTPWVDREGSRFIWLLEYRGAVTFEAADAAYHASPERAALDPDPAQWIAAQELVWLEPIARPGVDDVSGQRPRW